MRATLSILGLYYANEDLFDDLQLPTEVDKDVFLDNLLAECAELEALYTDPDMMQYMIGAWSKKELSVWEKLAETLSYEYNPIENYDKHEDWGENRNVENTSASNSTGQSGIEETIENTGLDTTKVAGFDSETLTNREQTDNRNTTDTTSNTSQTSANTSNSTGEEVYTKTGRVHGNIGVTTTQHMIEEQRQVVQFNLTDYIITSFKKRFCLLLY